MTTDGAPLVNAATAIFSCEVQVLMNSVPTGKLWIIDSTEARNVKIKFDTTSKLIRKLAFGDDGIGMNAETLSRCLSLAGQADTTIVRELVASELE